MTPSRHALILAGAGHAHLVAMRRWIDDGFRPPAGTLLLSPTSRAWYSGMMPGLIAGRFSEDECAIDLAPLCKACGVDLMIGEIAQLDADNRTMTLADGRGLQYDYLSLNVGSVPPQPELKDACVQVVPAKPFAGFTAHWHAWRDQSEPMQLAVLGGGAAAFELALALQKSLPRAQLSLICGGELLSGYAPDLARRAQHFLNRRGIELRANTRIDRVADGWLMSKEQRVQTADALVIATGASPQPWQIDSGLACDAAGFIRVAGTLRSESHPEVLASGDCASQPGTPHSGVYAVRQGAVLSESIPALLAGTPLVAYQPQPRSLVLLATADGGALLSYDRWSAGGRLFGMWKDHLDLSFMRRHRLD
ncbi:FAD-dependent oxidoreductase [Halopseudomonas sp.]|jgi:NADH dehydrogenase FAD-containing subunit|uniref:FAD-dependent oxidoreductase n=1 Tax=Halopseudomonas sp. TaxID=2901191 RepID=UPI0039E5930F